MLIQNFFLEVFACLHISRANSARLEFAFKEDEEVGSGEDGLFYR